MISSSHNNFSNIADIFRLTQWLPLLLIDPNISSMWIELMQFDNIFFIMTINIFPHIRIGIRLTIIVLLILITFIKADITIAIRMRDHTGIMMMLITMSVLFLR